MAKPIQYHKVKFQKKKKEVLDWSTRKDRWPHNQASEDSSTKTKAEERRKMGAREEINKQLKKGTKRKKLEIY